MYNYRCEKDSNVIHIMHNAVEAMLILDYYDVVHVDVHVVNFVTCVDIIFIYVHVVCIHAQYMYM